MDQEREYTQEFVPDGNLVRYERTFTDNGDKMQVYLTQSYIETTEPRVITNYLNHAVEGIITRETQRNAAL